MKPQEDQLHLARHALLAIHDLASARLRNAPIEKWVEHDLRDIVRLAELALASPADATIHDTLVQAPVPLPSEGEVKP